jgi:hypothetical protein
MNTCIKSVQTWLNKHPKAKQWAWFITLWCAGLLAVVAFAYPIKWLMRSIS